MNPDTGKLHGIAAKNLLTGNVAQREGETLEEVLKRAQEAHDQAMASTVTKYLAGEPPPGTPVPPGWPRFAPGQELRPIKGMKFIIRAVDLDNQVIHVGLEKR